MYEIWTNESAPVNVFLVYCRYWLPISIISEYITGEVPICVTYVRSLADSIDGDVMEIHAFQCIFMMTQISKFVVMDAGCPAVIDCHW